MKLFVVMILLLNLAGCQSPPNIKQLESEKAGLQRQLDQSRQKVGDLTSENAKLTQELDEHNRVIAVLGQEKNSRVSSSTQLRGEIRSFVQTQVDHLKEFLLQSNLLDYVGAEQVARSSADEQSILLVDFGNPVPLDGTLTSVGGLFNKAGQMTVKVLRPVEDDLMAIWESEPLAVPKSGEQKLGFAVSVGVRKGDLIGYYIKTPGLLGFDTGTGDTRFREQDLGFGQRLNRSSLDGDSARRAYSVGVYGLLNAR